MEGYKRIRLAFELLETIVGHGFLAARDWEIATTNEYARLEALRRAAVKLAQMGARAAAESEGCCRATVYNRTHAHRKSKQTEIA